MINLKPCPFCGSDEAYITQLAGIDKTFAAMCKRCGASGPTVYRMITALSNFEWWTKVATECAKGWNDRPLPVRPPEPLPSPPPADYPDDE